MVEASAPNAMGAALVASTSRQVLGDASDHLESGQDDGADWWHVEEKAAVRMPLTADTVAFMSQPSSVCHSRVNTPRAGDLCHDQKHVWAQLLRLHTVHGFEYIEEFGMQLEQPEAPEPPVSPICLEDAADSLADTESLSSCESDENAASGCSLADTESLASCESDGKTDDAADECEQDTDGGFEDYVLKHCKIRARESALFIVFWK